MAVRLSFTRLVSKLVRTADHQTTHQRPTYSLEACTLLSLPVALDSINLLMLSPAACTGPCECLALEDNRCLPTDSCRMEGCMSTTGRRVTCGYCSSNRKAQRAVIWGPLFMVFLRLCWEPRARSTSQPCKSLNCLLNLPGPEPRPIHYHLRRIACDPVEHHGYFWVDGLGFRAQCFGNFKAKMNLISSASLQVFLVRDNCLGRMLRKTL